MFFPSFTTFTPYVENMSDSFSFDMNTLSSYTASVMNYANNTAYTMVDRFQTFEQENPESALFVKALFWMNLAFLGMFMTLSISDSSVPAPVPTDAKLFEASDNMADEMTAGFTGRRSRRSATSPTKVRHSPRLAKMAQARREEPLSDRVYSYLRDGIYTSKDLARLMDVDKRVINGILYKNLREGTVERTLMGERPFWTAR